MHHHIQIKRSVKMELQLMIKPRMGSKSFNMAHALGIPVTSYQTSLKPHLPDPANRRSKLRYGTHSVVATMIKLGESMEKLSRMVKGKLTWGARILQVGGIENVFKKKFKTSEDEKLLKASQCYIYTTAGPIAGVLFVSSHKVAFCSNRSIKCSSASGKLLKLHYKVMIPLGKIMKVNESENVTKPKQKYVQLVTEDNFDFWFMGFINHQKAFNYLENAIHEAHKTT